MSRSLDGRLHEVGYAVLNRVLGTLANDTKSLNTPRMTSQGGPEKKCVKKSINSASSASFPISIYFSSDRPISSQQPTRPCRHSYTPFCSPFCCSSSESLTFNTVFLDEIHHTVTTLIAYSSRRVVPHFLLSWCKCECKEAPSPESTSFLSLNANAR